MLFTVIFRIRCFPPACEHARFYSILKHGKDPALASSYRPISLPSTAGKLSEKILLIRILCEISGCGLLRNEQFAFRHTQLRYSSPAL